MRKESQVLHPSNHLLKEKLQPRQLLVPCGLPQIEVEIEVLDEFYLPVPVSPVMARGVSLYPRSGVDPIAHHVSPVKALHKPEQVLLVPPVADHREGPVAPVVLQILPPRPVEGVEGVELSLVAGVAEPLEGITIRFSSQNLPMTSPPSLKTSVMVGGLYSLSDPM